MYPNYSQFPNHAPDPKQVPKKIKSSGGANPYKQLNQMLDFQLKQAKLEKVKEKKEGKRPPPGLSLNASTTYSGSSDSYGPKA